MQTKLSFEQIPDAIFALSKDVVEIKECLQNAPEFSTKIEKEEVLTREETAEFIKVSLVTLWSWAKKDLLVPYRIGRETRYLKSDILEALKKGRIKQSREFFVRKKGEIMSKPPHHHSPLLIEHEDTHFHNSFHAVIALEMQRPSDWDQEPEQVPKNSDPNLFTILPAQEWLKRANSRPIPKMLFGEFWFESELCILFADTNLGKSILAVQIGDSISRGIPIKGT